jgi:ketosteroid isomerase-like protein
MARPPSSLDQRLHEVYELLQKVIQDADQQEPSREAAWYAPPLPPIDPGSRISATDLLSWWFRPPTTGGNPWDSYFGDTAPQTKQVADVPRGSAPSSASPTSAQDPVSRAAFRALLAQDDDDLSAEDADSAVEVFYEFLHAFGRGDVEEALQYVAEDYHTFENDCEVNRNELANRLENLLASLHGWDFNVSLAMVPEPLRHPYGIVIYAEIQIDAVHPESKAKRNLVKRPLVLLEQQSGGEWKIAAFSEPRT